MNVFDGEPAGTQGAIMEATFHALCEHGYANLTVERIGREFEKSPSLIYHHYGGKDELLVDFLAFVLDRFEEEFELGEYDDAHEHLRALLDQALAPSLGERRAEFVGAVAELRAQAVHDRAYRDHFTRSNRLFHDRIAGVVRAGIDEGVFREVPADQVAELLVTTIDGAMTHRVTTDRDGAIRAVRAELDEYVRARLLCDEALASE